MESSPIPLKVSSLGIPLRTDLDLDGRKPELVDLAKSMESKTPISVEDSKYHSVGTMSVFVTDYSALIAIQDMYWHFSPEATKELPPPVMKTLGQLTLPVSVDGNTWFTVCHDYFEKCLRAVNWIAFLFPCTKKEYLCYEKMGSRQYFTQQKWPTWDVLDFSENRVHIYHGTKNYEFFKDAACERDITVLYTLDNPRHRGVTSKNFSLERIPIDVRDWFQNLEPESFQFVMLSSKQIGERHLNFIIKKWTRDELENLVLVRAKYVEDLNMSEIKEGLKVLEREDVCMEQYRTKTHLYNFYNQPRYYVKSQSGKVASFHYYPTQGHFFFVVWDSRNDEETLTLHSSLNSHQDMTPEPIPFVPFPFLKLPEAIFIKQLRTLNTAELLIMLEMDPIVEEYASRFASAGALHLCNLNQFFLVVGNLRWDFGTEPYGREPTMKKVGPFTLPVEERGSIWYTKTDDCLAQALKVAIWILRFFPLTKFKASLLLAEHPTPEHLQLISTIDFEKCTETNFTIDFMGDARNVFRNQVKNKDLIQLHISMGDNVLLRANAMNLKDNAVLDISLDWFTISRQYKWQFLLTSTPKMTEENLNCIIAEWMKDKLPSLVYFRAIKLNKLNEAKIFAGLKSEEWNDTAMDEYHSKVHFAKFFEEKGTVFKSISEQCASFHLDEKNGICHFVVWNSTTSEHSLRLFAELDQYQSVPIQ